MRSAAEIAFWLLALLVAYAYVLYPLAIGVIARLRPRPPQRQAGHAEPVSVIVAAFNEQNTIARRVDELVKLIDASPAGGELIVVSDGSTDHTVTRAREIDHPALTVIELARNGGKAVALNAGVAAARHPVLVFADARQAWNPDVLALLLENFADPRVGAVSGELILESSPGVIAGVGLYWRYEKWLRRLEAMVHSTVGVTGAICAVRRELWPTLPAGTILDDVHWPMTVAMRGRRVLFDGRARAFDRLPAKAADEFRRKVRTMSGNFQLVAQLPGVLLPWRNPLAVQFVSHKLARLAVPWAMLALLVLSALLLPSVVYGLALSAQLAFYTVGILALTTRWGGKLPLASAIASFLVLNAAAAMGLWVWLGGGTARSWKKVSYELPPAETPAPEA